MQAALHNCPNLDIVAGSVFDLVLSHPSVTTDFPLSEIRGVKLGWSYQVRLKCHFLTLSPDSGEVITCSQVVICTGTFLSGEIHIGLSPPSVSQISSSRLPEARTMV